MILKKPYVLLIKYFRLIHVLLGSLIIYSIYKTNSLLSFFNNLLDNYDNYSVSDYSGYKIGIGIFVVFVFVLIISLLLLWLMFKKKKPFRFYLYNTLAFLFILFSFMYFNAYLSSFSSKAIDVLAVRVIRDLLIILMVLQSLSILFCFIRSIGFDLKKFEFMSDLQEIEINSDDQEEIEVEFNFDSNERKRKKKRSLRYLKYSYKENKVFINFVIIILIIFGSIFVYNKYNIYTVLNKEGKILSSSYYDFSVDNSYLINSSYNNKVFTNNYLVVINLKIRSKNIYNQLSTGNFKLCVNDIFYKVTNNYDKYISDIGTVYNNDFLNSDYKNFLLVYEIPKDSINGDMKLFYYENGRSIRIKLNPTFSKPDIIDYSFNEKMEIENNVIIIDDYEVRDEYLINYDFCIKDECYKSIKYLVPTLNKNYDKAILKLHVNYNGNDDFNNLILNMGSINYSFNGEDKVSSLEAIYNIKGDGIYYYEVNREIMDSDSIKLVFNTRKCKYVYNLK